MVVIRGTKKFLARVGVPGGSGLESSGRLGDWYANLWFRRPQVALFVSTSTLPPVLVGAVPANSLLSRLPGALFGPIEGGMTVGGEWR